ncbi:hypothetical protein CYMTET_46349, partial [Cymbomonas tetramitiformis]
MTEVPPQGTAHQGPLTLIIHHTRRTTHVHPILSLLPSHSFHVLHTQLLKPRHLLKVRSTLRRTIAGTFKTCRVNTKGLTPCSSFGAGVMQGILNRIKFCFGRKDFVACSSSAQHSTAPTTASAAAPTAAPSPPPSATPKPPVGPPPPDSPKSERPPGVEPAVEPAQPDRVTPASPEASPHPRRPSSPRSPQERSQRRASHSPPAGPPGSSPSTLHADPPPVPAACPSEQSSEAATQKLPKENDLSLSRRRSRWEADAPPSEPEPPVKAPESTGAPAGGPPAASGPPGRGPPGRDSAWPSRREPIPGGAPPSPEEADHAGERDWASWNHPGAGWVGKSREKKGGTRAGTRMSGEEARAVTTGMVEETGKGIVVAGSMALAVGEKGKIEAGKGIGAAGDGEIGVAGAGIATDAPVGGEIAMDEVHRVVARVEGPQGEIGARARTAQSS